MERHIIRRARLADVPKMMPLIDDYARQAEILPRTETDVYQSIRDWVVAESAGKIVGMGSLLIMWHDLAEIRSLVIAPDHHGQGIGREIVQALVEEAIGYDLPRVFALTRQPGFFLKIGFQLTRIENLPRKVQKDCVFCPKLNACDEVAVVLPLTDGPLQSETGSIPVTVAQNGHASQAIIPLILT